MLIVIEKYMKENFIKKTDLVFLKMKTFFHFYRLKKIG